MTLQTPDAASFLAALYLWFLFLIGRLNWSS